MTSDKPRWGPSIGRGGNLSGRTGDTRGTKASQGKGALKNVPENLRCGNLTNSQQMLMSCKSLQPDYC